MKFDFQNKQGHTLSGQLEIPSKKPVAYALFAHCFTCSKNIIAPSTISKTLTDSGIAVLRFDFTGLGNSEGDFANTNFSSNVEDLLSACEALSQKYDAPKLLIGHSLGGAAVIKAAAKLSHVSAIATIAAPSDVEHVTHLFKDSIDAINDHGEADVQLAGREFKIKKQFIEDLKGTSILDDLKKMRKSILVLHSPIDDTVSVEHASKIFMAAHHPKSFISLDQADHLLMNRDDATYAGEVIGAWALKFLHAKKEIGPTVEKDSVLVKSRIHNNFTQDIYTKDHHIVADEPKSLKGNNLGMNPYELLLSSLGACTSMTLKMYAQRKELKLEGVEVLLKHQKIHAKDCEHCESQTGMIDVIEKTIKIEGDLSSEQRDRLYEIAEKCPVNKTLKSEIKIIPSRADK